MVTRFSPDDDKTHGHHTASAILATEAFAAAADPNRFPEQLAFVKPGKRSGWFGTRLRFSFRTGIFHSIRPVCQSWKLAVTIRFSAKRSRKSRRPV